jgi:hypothetical protein
MPPVWERRSRRRRGIEQVTFGVSILFFVAWTTVVHPTTNVRAVLDAAFLADGRLPVVATEVTCLSIAVGLVPTGLEAEMVAGSSVGVRAEQFIRSRSVDDVRLAREVTIIKEAERIHPSASESSARTLIHALQAAYVY